VSFLRCLIVLFALCAAPGCTYVTYWVRPESIRPNGEVAGSRDESDFPPFTAITTRMKLGRPGDLVKMWLQPASRLCGAEPPVTLHSICKLDGKLVRLEVSADGSVVTGLVVRPTSFVIDDFVQDPGKPPNGKRCQCRLVRFTSRLRTSRHSARS
jgi:hypothetical protein